MVWYILFGAFGAFGLLCALWTVCGYLLLPMGRGSNLIFLCGAGDTGKAEAILRYFSWLSGMGLYKGKLLLVDDGLTQEELAALEKLWQDLPVELCKREALAHRLEVEREAVGGT